MSPDPAPAEPFTSASALRDANRELLDRLAGFDGPIPPSSFLEEVERFQQKAAATGACLFAPEDRSEAQSIINLWLTVQLTSGRAPSPLLLAEFDSKAALKRAAGAAPYKGLEAFQVEDSLSFFGRLSSVREMLDRLGRHRLLAVTGLSGSGKSSVVRAGLIPKLREGIVEGSREWLVLSPFVPGKAPMAALAAAVRKEVDPELEGLDRPEALPAALDRAGRPVLVSIDQFEELFTLGATEEDRCRFLDALLAAATEGRHRHIVVVTMRSEFDGHLVTHPAFAELFEAGRVPIRALSAQELRAAIEQPALQVGVHFETRLAEELVQSVLGEPAGLPLLQVALLELWESRSKENLLTLEAYKRLGGSPREILARKADRVLDSFAMEQDHTLSRRIFLALVGSGLEPTSRRVERADLGHLGSRDNVDRVLGVWSGEGLIRISPDGPIGPASLVEVTHEALIRNWKQLETWIEENLAATKSRRVLNEQATAWAEKRQDTLLGELSLQEAEAQLEDLDEVERRYVLASRAEVDRANRSIKRRKLGALAAMAAGLLLLAVGAWQFRIARSESDRADAATQASLLQAATFRKQTGEMEAYARKNMIDADIKLLHAEQALKKAKDDESAARSAHERMKAQLAGALRARDAALARRQQIGAETEVAQGELERIRAQIEAAYAERLTDAQQAVQQATDRLNQQVAIQTEERPMIVVDELREGRVPSLWAQLRDRRAAIVGAAGSVGRLISFKNEAQSFSTAFMVAEGIAIATPTDESMPESVSGWTVSFGESERDAASGIFNVRSLVGVILGPEPHKNLLLLRLEDRSTTGAPPPPPLSLAMVRRDQDKSSRGLLSPSASPGELAPGMQVYLIGYPVTNEGVPVELADSEIGRLKRVQPGFLLDWSADGDGLQLRYDASSLGGSSGSPVIDLASGRVIGVHWGGGRQQGKFGTAFTDAVLNSAAARKAGLRAQGAPTR